MNINSNMDQGSASLAGRLFCLLLSSLLTFSAFPASAFAVTEDIYAEADAAQQVVEQTARDYEDAQNRISELKLAIAENESRLAELQERIPDQQEKGGEALAELYKMRREGSSLITLLLSAGDFMSAITSLDFLNRIYDEHWGELERLVAMRADFDSTQAALRQEMADAEQAQAAAAQALEDAQEAREKAQAAAQAAEEAERKAAEEAARTSEEESQAENAPASSGSSSQVESGAASNGSEQVVPPEDDNADWSSDKAAFVSQWAGRIDAYLAGSPLSGYGSTFAEAAWDYGVDPRFSPAISCVESSKGAACAWSHNAWGWGSVSWPTWEEAIASHVRGLARGYGYSLTIEGAKRYCPPNWQHWYNRVGEEMNKI